MALKGQLNKKADKVKAPKYKSSFVHRTANKERRIAKEADLGRKPREHRKPLPSDDGLEEKVSLGIE